MACKRVRDALQWGPGLRAQHCLQHVDSAMAHRRGRVKKSNVNGTISLDKLNVDDVDGGVDIPGGQKGNSRTSPIIVGRPGGIAKSEIYDQIGSYAPRP